MTDAEFERLAQTIMEGDALPSGHEDMVREARRARESERNFVEVVLPVLKNQVAALEREVEDRKAQLDVLITDRRRMVAERDAEIAKLGAKLETQRRLMQAVIDGTREARDAAEAERERMREALRALAKVRGCKTCNLSDDACDAHGEKTQHTTCAKLNKVGRIARDALAEQPGRGREKP